MSEMPAYHHTTLPWSHVPNALLTLSHMPLLQTPVRDMYFLEKLVGLGVDDGVAINSIVQHLFLIMGVWPLVSEAVMHCKHRGLEKAKATNPSNASATIHASRPASAMRFSTPGHLALTAGLHRVADPLGQVGQWRARLALHHP